jgi:hypothetical protein
MEEIDVSLNSEGINKDVCIIIATHKQYQMPADDIYLPLHVGAEGKKDSYGKDLNLGYTKDNTGDNISELNSSFCELTGLYWAWKNIDSDYIGLVHYRRHFCIKKCKQPLEGVIKYVDIKPYLGKVKVFVPNKRRYYIETLYSHYAHTHYASQLDETRQIIFEKYPEYVATYDEVLEHTYGYMFNMMIMDKKLLNEYCTWLFDILFELRKRLDMPELSAFQGRFYGRVSEIIFNVWLSYNIKAGRIKKQEIKEVACIHMEKINWWKKGTAFLKAKFFHTRYEGSF